MKRDQEKAMWAKKNQARNSIIDQNITDKEKKVEKVQTDIRNLTLMPLPDIAFIEGKTNRSVINDLQNKVEILQFDINRLKDEKIKLSRTPEEQKELDRVVEEIFSEFHQS